MALTKQDLKEIRNIVQAGVLESELRIKSGIQSLRLELESLRSELREIKEKIERIWKSIDEDLAVEHQLIVALQRRLKIFEKRLSRVEAIQSPK